MPANWPRSTPRPASLSGRRPRQAAAIPRPWRGNPAARPSSSATAGGVLAGVDLKSGEVLWTTPGGGDCTPAIAQDALAVQTGNPKVGILAGKLTATGFAKLWNIPYDPLRSQSSPLILDGHVYLMDDNIHYCFDLATGCGGPPSFDNPCRWDQPDTKPPRGASESAGPPHPCPPCLPRSAARRKAWPWACPP